MAVDQARIKWLARSGEDLLRKACTDAQLTPTKPEYDENGWDFLVEFPPFSVPNIYLDARPSPIKVFIQVKASDSVERLVIKVSNHEHLAKMNLPTFVLVIDYNHQDSPKNVYLCHFSTERIGKALMRVREIAAKGIVELHQHDMRFPVSSSDEVNIKDRYWLKDGVQKYTGTDLSSYIESKSYTLKNLGYGDGRYSFSFFTEAHIGDLVDAHLGLRELEIKHGTISTTRFGIDMAERRFDAATVKISASPSGECSVIARSRQRRLRAENIGQVITPHIPDLPKEFFKVRVNWPLTYIVASTTGGTLHIALDENERFELYSFIAAVETVLICFEPDAEIKLQKDNSVFAVINIKLDKKNSEAFYRLHKRLLILRDFMRAIGLNQEVHLSTNELFAQEEQIKWMDLALNPTKGVVKMRLSSLAPVSPQTTEGNFASPIIFDWDKYSLVSFFLWRGRFKVKKQTIDINLKTPEFFDRLVTEGADRDAVKKMQDEFRTYSHVDKGVFFQRLISTDGDA